MDKKIKDIIESLNINIVSEFDKNEIIECRNFYFDNLGYHFVQYQTNSILLLKGIYKDFIRVVEGEKFLKDSEFTKLSEFLSDIEKNIGQAFTAKVIKGKKDLVDITLVEDFEKLPTKNRLSIKRPLSNVEYNICRQDSADYDNLYFNTIFKEIFPNTISPLTSSILNNIPEVLAIIFAHANFRTYSPSLKSLWNKVYCSFSNYHMAFESLNSNDTYLKLNYSQYRFVKDKKNKLKIPKMTLLDIKRSEINEFLDEVDSKLELIDEKFIFQQEYLELISLLFLAGQMIYLGFSELFLKLNDIVKNTDNSLRLIYKTRENSIFFSNQDLEIPDSFDMAAKLYNIKMNFSDRYITLKEGIDKFSGVTFFKKGKLETLLKDIHSFLSLRDKLSIIALKVFSKTQETFNILANYLLKESKIKDKETIYYLEYTDLKNIVEDNYYGNIQFTYYFKKWQNERFKLQFVPYEIFEKDIPDTENIVKNIINKFLKQKEFNILSFFHDRDSEYDFNELNTYSKLTDIVNWKSAPIITDNISLLSYAMEYAAINDIPVYSGLRFFDIIFENKKASISKNKLIIL